jgi:hypothetical protein
MHRQNHRLSLWQEEGFAREPQLLKAGADVVLYRVTGHGTVNPAGNCFFVPARVDVKPADLTAVEMEYNLNAGIWGNGFQRLHLLKLRAGTHYWQGAPSQRGLVGRSGQQSEFRPPGDRPVRDQLLQVVLVQVDRDGLVTRTLTPLETLDAVTHLVQVVVKGSHVFAPGNSRNNPS